MGVMTGIGLGLLVGGTILNARGQKKQGDAAQEAANAVAEREEWNAGIAELQAKDAIARGADEESRFRTSVRQLIGSQRAGFAGQGVEVGRGSAADVQADAAFLGELDARQIRLNAARQAWGFQVEAADRRLGADVARRGGAAAKSASRWAMASTIVGGAAQGTSMLADRYGWNSPKAGA